MKAEAARIGPPRHYARILIDGLAFPESPNTVDEEMEE